MEKKQATQTDVADLRVPSKGQSSGRDANPTNINDGGRRNNDDRKVPDEGAQVSHDGEHEKSLSATFDSSMFKNTSVSLKAEDELKLERGNAFSALKQFDDKSGAVTGKGNPSSDGVTLH